jgi:hypothetical protein
MYAEPFEAIEKHLAPQPEPAIHVALRLLGHPEKPQAFQAFAPGAGEELRLP